MAKKSPSSQSESSASSPLSREQQEAVDRINFDRAVSANDISTYTSALSVLQSCVSRIDQWKRSGDYTTEEMERLKADFQKAALDGARSGQRLHIAATLRKYRTQTDVLPMVGVNCAHDECAIPKALIALNGFLAEMRDGQYTRPQMVTRGQAAKDTGLTLTEISRAADRGDISKESNKPRSLVELESARQYAKTLKERKKKRLAQEKRENTLAKSSKWKCPQCQRLQSVQGKCVSGCVDNDDIEIIARRVK